MAQVLRGDGGGAGRREINSRGGASPEKSESGLPGVESSGIRVARGLRDTRDAPGHSAGLGKDCNGERGYCGGSARRGSPELCVLPTPGVYLGKVWPGSEYER